MKTMIKKILILCLILLQGITSSAMTPEQKKTVLNKISTAAAALPSMTCDFTQTKKVSLVKETMTSQGKMYYKKPDKLRWEYTSPYTYTFIFNGTKVSVKNSKKKSVIDTQSNKVFKEVARIMMNTVTGKALNNPADYGAIASNENIGLIMDVPLEVTVELGRTSKSISEILDFAPGTIIELDKIAGEPIDVLVNGKFVAKGEVVVIEESFGIRVTEIIK